MLFGREYVGVNRLLVRGGRSASDNGGGGVVGGRGKFMSTEASYSELLGCRRHNFLFSGTVAENGLKTSEGDSQLSSEQKLKQNGKTIAILGLFRLFGL